MPLSCQRDRAAAVAAFIAIGAAPPPLSFDPSSSSCPAGVATRILPAFWSSPAPSSPHSSPVRVDAMSWDAHAVSSPANLEQHAPSPRRHIPVSILLNPSDDDEDDNELGCHFEYNNTQHPNQEDDSAMQSLLSASSSGSESAEKTTAALTTTTTTMTLAVTAQPKRRGRKPHLPKMNNSERGKYYRNKRKRYGDTLSDEVELLREHIERLRALRDICCDLRLGTRRSLLGSLAKLVREYFVQFRHGVQLPPSRRNMALADVELSTTQQEHFVNATMEPDVGFGEYRGIDTIMDQWRRYSQWHALLSFELISMEMNGSESEPIIAIIGRLRTRYSRKTIENVFPHVAGNEPLIQRLIGREIVYPCKNQFFFNEHGRVERYDVEANFVEAMVNALGNTADAALLLGQALIQKQHMMGILDEDDSEHNNSRWVKYIADDNERDPEGDVAG